MARALVIVESPAKGRTIAQILGNEFEVAASMGHVRDLGAKGLNVDVENDFKVDYVVTKPDVVRDLRTRLKDAQELYLATDEDREGEAISWHLSEVLKPRVPVRRMVFHEITPTAIAEAVRNWREIDYGLVDAQETRRILDRLYGYEVSPVLWRKVGPGLSAGRVQSVAVRLVVERERERMRFRSAAYWDLEASHPTDPPFVSTLVSIDGRRVAAGRDFDELGALRSRAGDVIVVDQQAAEQLSADLTGATFAVRTLDEKPYRTSPKAPFITSTLQQEGARKLGMSAAQVMRIAQGLYERGYITYMRTDSTNLADVAVEAARTTVRELYGPDYLPQAPRVYAKKVKNAQEAHEAIRPAGERWRTPDQLSRELSGADLRLYELVWKRTIACQMADATGLSLSVRLGARANNGGRDCEFAASGRTITFPGYLRAYVEGSDDPDAELDDRESRLPQLTVGQVVPVDALTPKSHATTPPARYTEASLVKRLEELGIGRPSTYASIMGTIQDRGYVWKRGQALIPSWTAFAVVNLLEQHFGSLVDYAFTARMEDDLDDIANREKQRSPWLHAFYFGNNGEGLQRLVSEHLGDIDAAEINSIVIGEHDGESVVVKPGRYGPYVKMGEATASVPDDVAPDEMSVEKALELLAAPKGDEPIGADPETGLDVYAKNGRFGPYVQLGDVDHLPPGEKKPRMASLLSSMSLETVTLDDALKLLSLPRTLGVVDGEEVVVANGRFGPFVKKGGETRSLESEEQLFSLDLNEALAVLAQPKSFRGRGRTGAPRPPLAELGDDPVSGKPIVAREGRFGPYVTDGETNASLRKGDSIETLTPERASELLAARRELVASGGGRPARGRKSAATKAAGKKAGAAATSNGEAGATAANKAAKKATAKKTPAKTAAKKAAAKKSAGTKASPAKAAAKKAAG